MALPPRVSVCTFLSTPSARRATRSGAAKLAARIFLSTPSARRATVDIKTHADRDDISIHALREEGDHGGGDTMTQWSISIHALREEGDVKRSHLPGAGDNFYPRPPRGGRQPPARVVPRRGQFLSTPSARRATPLLKSSNFQPDDFYPRPPRGGRRGRIARESSSTVFLSTPSARRATLTGQSWRSR